MPSALCRPASFGSAALVLSLVCSLASGRQPVGPGQLPCELASKQSLDGGDEAAIRQFIATHAPGLTSDDAEAISKSREAMLSPLGCAGITFAFRSKYADLLTPVLTPIAGSKEEIQAVNALLVLGRLRTTLSSDALSGSLKAGNPVIRFAAASGYRDLLSQLSKDSFGFPES
ncbi:MAG: hypothetical protein JNK58_03295, partial [Phycisphaerae bacterium]|nr:hypothetical protein [Phycisphaerae bacterium]